MIKQKACLKDYRDKERELHESYVLTRDPRKRECLVMMHQSLVRFLAGKFMNRGEPLEDLIQVGNIGLINAIDRFDPGRGLKFSTYATPTIVGEIRRHFRDKCRILKVPRRLQELNLACNKAAEKLAQKLGRTPEAAELALAVNATEEEVLKALKLGNAYETVSIDAPLAYDSESSPLTFAEFMGELDLGIKNIEDNDDLFHAIKCLKNDRMREIVFLRFFENMTQTDVAKKLGISQMKVSRLQKKALSELMYMLTDFNAKTQEEVKPFQQDLEILEQAAAIIAGT